MWINKIIYLLITVYAAILAVLYSEVQSLYVFIALLLFPLFLFLQVLLVRRKLKITLLSKTRLAVAGTDSIHMSLLVSNAAILPVTCVKVKVSYLNAFSEEPERQVFTISVGAKSEKQIDFVLQSSHTGLIKIKVVKVKVYDFIRLFSKNKKTEALATVPVLPVVNGIGSNLMIRDPDFIDSEVYSKSKPGDDPSEVFDIREYKEGDRIHRIHWKLSSKKDTIMVKDYSLPIANSATVLINTALPKELIDKLSYLDALLETTASVSYHLLLNEYHHHVAWYDQKESNYMSTNLEDFDGMYYMMSDLIRITPTEEKNNILEAHQVYGNAHQIIKLYYITYELTEETVEMLMNSYGHAQVEVLILTNHEPEEEEDYSLGQQLHKQYIAINNRKTSIEALQL